MRLVYVVLHTADLPRLMRFYRDRFLIGVRFDSPHWVELDTAGCTLALHLGPADAAAPPAAEPFEEISLSLQVEDLDVMVAESESRGVEFLGGIETQPSGRVAHFRDPMGNLVSVHELRQVAADGLGPLLSTVILNCQDVAEMQSFYQDRVGLGLRVESPHWVEFDMPGTTLALHPWSSRGAERLEHGVRPVVFGFRSPDVRTWISDLQRRDVRVVTEPTNQGWGTHAEVADPDGNIIILREAATATSGGRKDGAPSSAGRKAASRRRPAKAAAQRTVKPSGSRPATGRLRKAERRTLKRAAVAKAASSKGRVPRQPAKKSKGGTRAKGRKP